MVHATGTAVITATNKMDGHSFYGVTGEVIGVSADAAVLRLPGGMVRVYPQKKLKDLTITKV